MGSGTDRLRINNSRYAEPATQAGMIFTRVIVFMEMMSLLTEML